MTSTSPAASTLPRAFERFGPANSPGLCPGQRRRRRDHAMKVSCSEMFMICIAILGIWACASLETQTRPLIPDPGLPSPRLPGEYRGPTVEQFVLAMDHDSSSVEIPE